MSARRFARETYYAHNMPSGSRSTKIHSGAEFQTYTTLEVASVHQI